MEKFGLGKLFVPEKEISEREGINKKKNERGQPQSSIK